MKKIIYILLLLFSLTLLVSCDDNVDVKEEETYNIVLTNATVPPLMAVLDVLDNGHKTYMWYGRTKTFFDIEGLKENIEFIGDPENQEDIPGIKGEVLSEMKNIVTQLYYDSKEKTNFNLYVVDYGIKAALEIFVESGIKEDNYKVYLLEDGTGTYNQFNNVENYSKVNGKENFDNNAGKLDEIIEKVSKGNYIWDNKGNMDNWYLAYPYAAKSNVEYWMQYPEILTSEDPLMNEYLEGNNINLVKKKLSDMFLKLDEEKQEIFQNAILDYDHFNSIINKDNGKKALLVTGTSYDGEELGFVDGIKADGELEFVMDYIIENYGNDYNIMFKPHPAWMPSLGEDMGVRWRNNLGKERPNEWEGILKARVKYFEDNNITVLPGQTPIEPILWAFPDVKIGGYNSSLYMNAAPFQVEFFILQSSDLNNLSSPLPEIIKAGGLTNPNTNKNPIIISPEMFEG